ncbi:MAG TPA: PAS domain S-box protein [Pyrinomonadaceae bacterium]|nr:PAS domain S-box protein [Pyrinomonadaceae bacterium]
MTKKGNVSPPGEGPETSEIRYRRLFETAPDGILILNALTKKITDANPFMVDLLGYSRAEFLGHELWEFGLFENAQAGREAFRELLKGSVVRYGDLSLRTKSGERRDVEFVGNVYELESSRVVQCNIRDITARKAAEEALQEIHRRLTFHVENTPLAVLEWDSDFRLSRWSASAERLFGWKAEEVLGKRITDWNFVFADDVQAVKQIRMRQSSGEQHGVSKNRNYTKDGSVLHCEWYNSVLYDKSDRVESILSLVLDVTARNEAEHEKAQLLLREQEARKEAEAANRSKDIFLATLSHELRTPLASILGWARLLGSDMVDQTKYPQVFETIARNAKVQAQLIDDLLDVSRIITGKLRLDVRPVALAPIIEATVETVRPAAAAKEIQFKVDLDPRAGEISGDPDRLQQLMWNLLSNAIKFTPKGGRVQVQLQQAASQVEITVSDSGQGIEADFLPHAFERFRQADGSSARKYGGLGLGLAIVRHLTELHGGTVEADSKGEGKGATFKVSLPTLPAKQADGVKAEPKRRAIADNELSKLRPVLEGLRVLIVDDEPDVRNFGLLTFAECGAEAEAASSVAEALQIFEQWRPDVLVADIGMPDEDGFTLIHKVRSLAPDRGGRTPALALTAYARTEDRVRILSAGYQIHVAKPVEPVELIAAVASLAGRSTDH